MKILGIDPGLLNLGCVLIKIDKGDFEILKAKTFKTKRTFEITKKLVFLYQSLKAFIEEDFPDYIVVEDVLPHANPQSTVKISQVQALVLLLSEEKGIPLKLYHPSYWKAYLCGNGLSQKEEILNTLRRFFKGKIDDKIKDEHLADALSLALVFAMENNFLNF